MVELALRQQQLWALLMEHSHIHPMLRVSREDDCLWICDLPRRVDAKVYDSVEQHLHNAGFIVSLNESSRLWHIDLPITDRLLKELSGVQTLFPKNESLHTAYALYQLLISHSSPQDRQPLPLLRSILKLTLKTPEEAQTAIVALTNQCAALLNRKQPLPSTVTGILAQWINQEDQT